VPEGGTIGKEKAAEVARYSSFGNSAVLCVWTKAGCFPPSSRGGFRILGSDRFANIINYLNVAVAPDS